MAGGLGGDIYLVENAGDQVVETRAAGGTDRVQASVDFTLGANLENLTLAGSSAIDGTGNGLNNSILGNAAANRIDGGAGVDYMAGGLGDDIYVVDNVGDRVAETRAAGGTDTVQSAATFTLGANLENLTLTGVAAINGTGNGLANILTGNAAANSLSAGGGDDDLIGGGGADQLLGGAGLDTFFFNQVSDSTNAARDRIGDFSEGDKIDLVGLAAASGLSSFSFIGGNAATGAGQVRVEQNGQTALVQVFTNADAVADLVLEVTVPAGYTLGADDFNLGGGSASTAAASQEPAGTMSASNQMFAKESDTVVTTDGGFAALGDGPITSISLAGFDTASIVKVGRAELFNTELLDLPTEPGGAPRFQAGLAEELEFAGDAGAGSIEAIGVRTFEVFERDPHELTHGLDVRVDVSSTDFMI